MPRIDEIRAENYRGASSALALSFAKDKSVALLFGENGTGKSTIVDILDAVGNQSRGSLTTRSSTQAGAHIPTIGKRPSDIRVQVSGGGMTWTLSLNRNDLTSTPRPHPRVRVLRRSSMQKLVDAAPAERYEELRSLLDVGNVERAEGSLRDAAAAAFSRLDEAVKRRVEAENQLESLWAKEGQPGPSAAEWARAVAGTDRASLEADGERLRSFRQAMETASTAQQEFNAAVAERDSRVVAVNEVEITVRNEPGADVEQTMGLVNILSEVTQHLASGYHPDECPVCLQPVSVAALRGSIGERLGELAVYGDLAVRRQAVGDALHAAEAALATRRQSFLAAARALVESQTSDAFDVRFALTPPSCARLKEGGVSGDAVQEADALVTVWYAKHGSVAAAESAAFAKAGQSTAVTELQERIDEARLETVQLTLVSGALQAAHECARLTRIEFTQSILEEITAECNRLYAFVHPDERLAVSRLELDQARRASLTQAASFEGHDGVPPQAYFSDSHLDTLGFCFWLAAAEREASAADTVLVLDDIFTSADAQHIGRLAQLIVDERNHFAQIILTTHQRLWLDIYRNSQGASGLVELVELQRWTLDKGISSYKTRLAVRDLSDTLQALPFERRMIASKAGVLLEATLDFLALQHRCRVPRTADNSYVLRELLDGTKSLFKVLSIHRPSGGPDGPLPYTDTSPRAITDALSNCAFVRNQVGAHYNISGLSIADADVEAFAKLVVDLVEALSCDTCGQIPGKRTGTHIECSCPAASAIHLTPLQHAS